MNKINKNNSQNITNGINEVVNEIQNYEKCEDLTKIQIKSVINCLLETIENKLSKKEEVEFLGYFKFYTKFQEGGKKLSFGEIKEFEDCYLPKIKFSVGLKKRIKENS